MEGKDNDFIMTFEVYEDSYKRSQCYKSALTDLLVSFERDKKEKVAARRSVKAD